MSDPVATRERVTGIIDRSKCNTFGEKSVTYDRAIVKVFSDNFAHNFARSRNLYSHIMRSGPQW